MRYLTNPAALDAGQSGRGQSGRGRFLAPSRPKGSFDPAPSVSRRRRPPSHEGHQTRRGPSRFAFGSPFALACAALVAWGSGCSEPTLDGTRFSCIQSDDCAAEEVCAPLDGVMACLPASEAVIRIGMSGPLQGPSEDLGTEMRRGIEAKFEGVNRSGGIFGRPLDLTSLNDNYDPQEALEATLRLLDVREAMPEGEPDRRGPNGVFALLGNIGTPTMLATAPVANKNGVLFFGPFTGAQTYLRDGTNSPYVYNFRAGYYDETEAIVDYIANERIPRIIENPEVDYRRILVFAQSDSYGESGYRGVERAYNRTVSPLPEANAIQLVEYDREDVDSTSPSIAAAESFLLGLLANNTDRQSAAIVMVDTYQPGNKFIRDMKDWINADADRAARLDVLFVNVSFVGADALAESLTSAPATYTDILDASRQRSYAEGVMVTQVVPDYRSQAPGVVAYRNDIDRYDDAGYSFTSLEGYLVASLFVSALELNGPDLTTENLRVTLDQRVRNLDLGIGTTLNFSPDDHQASRTVWGTALAADGTFTVPFVWDPQSRIQSN